MFVFLFQRLGVANISSATVIKKEAVQSIDEPKWIYIDDDRLSKVESFLLNNSVLSQQLYKHQNQHAFQPSLTHQSCGSSTTVSVTTPETASSKSQAQGTDNTSATETNKDVKFWQDSGIQGADILAWEMPHVSNTTLVEGAQSNTNTTTSTNVAATSIVKDIFSGSPWKALSTEEHRKLDEQLLQEHRQRKRMLKSRLSWYNEETKKLPVADHR